jgi:3-oxoadipate enol-lactonase
MSSVDVNGGVLDVVEQGSGRPLLLLHSLLADRTVFDRVVPLLAPHRRVILVDLPGFGGSSSAGSAIEDFADRLAALFPALGLGKDTDVLGNGFGAFIASTLAIRHGRLLDRLVLVGTGVGFPEAGKAAFRTMAQRVRDHGMEGVVEIAMKRLFPDAFIAANPDLVGERRRALVKTDPVLFAQACEALANLDLLPRVGSIRNPTLIVVGSLDAATPPPMAYELAKSIKDAKLIELRACGHAPMAQDPQEFVGAISAFLGLMLSQEKGRLPSRRSAGPTSTVLR